MIRFSLSLSLSLSLPISLHKDSNVSQSTSNRFSLLKQLLQQWRCLLPCTRGPMRTGNEVSPREAGAVVTAVPAPCVSLSISFHLETRKLLRAQLKWKWREYFIFLSVCNKAIQLFTSAYIYGKLSLLNSTFNLRSKSLWRWNINTSIRFFDIHRLVFI
jgi:hypothetical protein